MLVLIGCNEGDNIELPEHINQIENLTVYSTEENPSYQIQLEKDKVFRDTEGVIGTIGELVVDEGGRVYVADSQQYVIHVFNADGSYETAFGSLSGVTSIPHPGPLVFLTLGSIVFPRQGH